VTVIDTAALSTAPVTLENYGRTANLNTLIVSWAIHADIYRNRYIHQFCPEAIESLTCISNRDITDCLSSVRVHERMRQAISKILSHWIISQLWERLLGNAGLMKFSQLLLLTMTITAEALMPCSLPDSGKLRHRLRPLTIKSPLRRPVRPRLIATVQPGTTEVPTALLRSAEVHMSFLSLQTSEPVLTFVN
jgi:hypothetical protein